MVGKVLEKSGNFGFDAQTEEYVDMVAAGIIDPTKVVRIALQDAASVASLLITTEAMVAERPKKESAPAMPPAAAWVEWAAWTTKSVRAEGRLSRRPFLRLIRGWDYLCLSFGVHNRQ